MELDEALDEAMKTPIYKMMAELTAKAFLKDYREHAVDTAFYALTCLVATGRLEQSAELDKIMTDLLGASEDKICCMMVAEEIVKQVKEADHGNE